MVSGNSELWRQCHASTLVRSPESGVVTVAWFAGAHEGAVDNAIWMSRGIPAGPWDAPKVVMRGHRRAWWNPVLAYGPDRRLWLFAKNGPQISYWKTWYRVSDDDGETWSVERELVPDDDQGGRGPVKNPPLVTSLGTWVAPNSIESGGDNPQWNCRFDISRDSGRTWQLRRVPLNRSKLKGAGIIQPTLWEMKNRSGNDGMPTLVAMCRSTEGKAFRTVSKDDGSTWSEAVTVDLPQNNSGFCAVKLDEDGRTAAIVHNPVSDSWGARCPLSISITKDGGLTWRQCYTIEDGKTSLMIPTGSHMPQLHTSADAVEGYTGNDGGIITSGINEYSYPTAIRTDDDELLVSYTWQRRAIVVARVPLDALKAEYDKA